MEAKGEVGGAADIFEWNAEETKRIYGQTVQSRFPNTRVIINYEPIGVVAALLSAIFTTLNKRFATNNNPFAITCVEMAAGVVVLGIPAVLGGLAMPTPMDAVWLLVLAVACTLLPFVVWIQSLRYVSAFTTLLMLNLEPVYAILMAAVLFKEYEDLTPLFYIGAGIVLLTVLLQPQVRRLARSTIEVETTT